MPDADARCAMPMYFRMVFYVFPPGFLCISAWFSMYFRMFSMYLRMFSMYFSRYFAVFPPVYPCMLPMPDAMRDAAIYTCVRFPSIFGCFLCISAWFSMYFRMFSM
jgi:hypothetical protein